MQDAWLMLAVGNDKQYPGFLHGGSRDRRLRKRQALPDQCGPGHALRSAHSRDRKAVSEKDYGYRVELLTQRERALRAINSIAEVFENPQVKHRKMRFDLPHALGGELPQVRNPVLFSRNTLDYSMPPPLLGAHTREVLSAELGLTDAEILSLETDGTIV